MNIYATLLALVLAVGFSSAFAEVTKPGADKTKSENQQEVKNMGTIHSNRK